MPIKDAAFNFSDQQALTGTSDVVSTNVYAVGANGAAAAVATKLFEGGGQEKKLFVQVTASGGTTPTFRARLVGADNAALTSNPIILAETGVSAALTAADLPVVYEINVAHQRTAKLYYGVIYIQAGTTPTATVNAWIGDEGQNNLVR
jgi:hypothetical protein